MGLFFNKEKKKEDNSLKENLNKNNEEGIRKILFTREEVDEALENLKLSSKSFVVPPESAMCYSMRMPSFLNVSFKCECCNKVVEEKFADYLITPYGFKLVNDFKNLASDYTFNGYIAEFKVICHECLTGEKIEEEKDEFCDAEKIYGVFSFDLDGEIISETISFREDRTLAYKAVLSFLQGSTLTVEELFKRYRKEMSSNKYYEMIKNILERK